MRKSEGRRAAPLVYVLGEFPSVSETFILREMLALQEMGFRIIPLAMKPGAGAKVHDEARELARRTLHRPQPGSLQSLSGLIKTALQRPFGLLSGILLALRHCLLAPGLTRELVSALLTASWFAAHLRGREARHIHAHFASYPATVGLLLAEITGGGFSLSCHARDLFTDESILLSRKLQEAEFVVVCTRYGLERLQRQYSLTSSDKLHLIYHGVDAARLLAQPRVRHPLPLVMSVGRLIEKKGFRFLLQAAAMVASRGEHFELVIVGDGPERDELQRMASGLGLRDKVIFTGILSQAELAEVYQRATVFCLASVVASDGDRDGLPNVVLEAMGYGVPVVASNLGAIPEAVHPEETGLLAAPGSAGELAEQIERALQDEGLRQRLARQGRRLVAAEFDLYPNAAQLGALFARALRLRQTPRQSSSPGRKDDWKSQLER
jgi:glycosyltransferase involved in cell wall biosynthesis